VRGLQKNAHQIVTAIEMVEVDLGVKEHRRDIATVLRGVVMGMISVLKIFLAELVSGTMESGDVHLQAHVVVL
jgi:hypothetical protein